MTHAEQHANARDIDESQDDEAISQASDSAAILQEIVDEQKELRADFERLAEVIEPITTRAFAEKDVRVRALERRILARQERPTVNRLAQLLSSTNRLHDAEDIKNHVQETVLDILRGLGYEQFGESGEPFDDHRHDVVVAETADEPLVTVVHARGLESFGDIIIRARVDVGRGSTSPVDGTTEPRADDDEGDER